MARMDNGTVAGLARDLDVTRTQVRSLVNRGLLPVGPDGTVEGWALARLCDAPNLDSWPSSAVIVEGQPTFADRTTLSFLSKREAVPENAGPGRRVWVVPRYLREYVLPVAQAGGAIVFHAGGFAHAAYRAVGADGGVLVLEEAVADEQGRRVRDCWLPGVPSVKAAVVGADGEPGFDWLDI